MFLYYRPVVSLTRVSQLIIHARTVTLGCHVARFWHLILCSTYLSIRGPNYRADTVLVTLLCLHSFSRWPSCNNLPGCCSCYLHLSPFRVAAAATICLVTAAATCDPGPQRFVRRLLQQPTRLLQQHPMTPTIGVLCGCCCNNLRGCCSNIL